MKILTKPIFALFFIVVLAVLLRGYQLGSVPQSINWDEASLGYNAYSILMTGRDEYGKLLPVVLQSFDDYKPALYVYFAIPFVAVLGLTEQAVRLPSMLAGISAVVIVYFLVLELLGSSRIRILKKEIPTTIVALVCAFLLSISPWHIQFSRVAYESNVGLTLNLLAFLLFLKGLKKHYLLPFSFFIAAANVHMYQSERVFSPLLMILLSAIFYKSILKIKKWILFSGIVAIITALPLLIYIATNSNALMRAKGVSVFSQQSVVEGSAEKLLNDEKTGYALGKVIDNRRVEFAKATVAGYISHFDPNWLFITGDLARHHAPFMGLLYIFELPFLLLGIYLFTYLKIDRRYKLAFFGYFLLVPVPASITSGVPHAVRTLNFAWTWELFISIGLVAACIFVFEKRQKLQSLGLRCIALVYMLLALINFLYFLNQYFVQLNYYNAQDWLYGYKQAIASVNSVRNEYDQVVVENQVPFDQSYMFFLFYLRVDPSYYQSLGGTKSGGFKEEHKGFYNFKFRSVAEVSDGGKILLMGRPRDLNEKSGRRNVIYYPDGNEAIVIAEK